jgi:hypothetical protein
MHLPSLGLLRFAKGYHRSMRWLFWMCSATLAFAQGGTEPKPKPEDYELHARSEHTGIGAEFMVHSFSGQGQTYIVKDFLVVEVALYPEKGTEVHADPTAFTLRINGNQRMLHAIAATAVVASIERPQWQQGGGPRMEGGAGVGGVILGIPGGGGQGQGRPMPAPPRAPDPAGAPGVDAPEQVSPNELLVRTAFPAGDFKGPVSGFIYFPYRGKMTSLKSLDLLFRGVVLKLR